MMTEFGNSLRLAREGKGLSVAQIADITHMAPKTVLDLEAENFSHIAAPIYGRGFVKLYCEAVGLDPRPFIDEFMAIYNGVRDVGIRERKPRPAPVAAQEPPAPTAAEEPKPADAAEPSAVQAPEPPPGSGMPPWPNDYALQPEGPKAPAAASPLAAEPPPATPLSRYATPVRQERASSPTLPPSVWRIGILSVVGLLVLWGLLAGVRALYRATSGTAAPTGGEPVAVETPEPAKADVKPAAGQKQAAPEASPKPGEASPAKAPRTPQKIPSLYID